MLHSLQGLILAGGYSTRMGMDKCMITYHGVPQHAHLGALLHELTEEVFLSCRREQLIETSLPVIIDKRHDIGPMAGLLAAFDHDPTAAWLVIACDMPLLDKACLKELIDQRNASKQATFFIDHTTQKPEPLLAIYEPSIFPLLKNHVEQQDFSLNRLLQACDGNPKQPAALWKLKSVNTKLEYEEICRRLEK